MRPSHPASLLVALAATTLCPACLWAGVYVDTPTRLWPNGVIPYEITASVTLDQRLVILSTMGAWSAVANVSFVPWTNQTPYYLFIDNITTNHIPSYNMPPGYNEGQTMHYLDLSDWGNGVNSYKNCQSVYGLAHEFGHALGLYHTHQGVNRDNYFIIRTNLIVLGREGNYAIVTNTLQWPRNEPDIDSIMTYPYCVFSICTNCSTNYQVCSEILLVPQYAAIYTNAICDAPQCPGPVECIGQRNHLSTWDMALMSYLYPQPNWRFAEAGSVQAIEGGTFHYPVKTFTNGVSVVPVGGILFMEPSTYVHAVGVYTKAMTIRATHTGRVVMGSVVIRQ